MNNHKFNNAVQIVRQAQIEANRLHIEASRITDNTPECEIHAQATVYNVLENILEQFEHLRTAEIDDAPAQSGTKLDKTAEIIKGAQTQISWLYDDTDPEDERQSAEIVDRMLQHVINQIADFDNGKKRTIELDIYALSRGGAKHIANMYSEMFEVQYEHIGAPHGYEVYQFTGKTENLKKLVKLYSSGQENIDTFLVD